MKRLIDIVGAALGLVVLSPVLAVAALAVRLTMGSPVLFRQERAGRHGRPFHLVKLRTMRPPRPDEHGFSTHDADRITRVGRFLRSTSIDEIPELVNVLRGDMSLVGPRPLPVHYLARYSSEQQRRHEVRPGLTGWAVVNGRNALTWDDRLAMDVWYVDHRSLRLDLRIIGMTVRSVVRREGIDFAEGTTMHEFEGPGS